MPSNMLRVAQHRDLIDEARAKITRTGPIYESAVDEFVSLYVAGAQFKLVGEEWIDQETQMTLDEAVLQYRESHAHSYADRLIDEEVEEREIDDAFTAPTPDKISRLAKKLGERAFNKLAKDYSFDIRRITTPGTRPVYAEDGTTVIKKKANPDNPWSAKGWNISKQGQLVKALGLDRAASVARSAGAKIGDTKPNPNFN